VNAQEAEITTAEQAALDRVVSMFPRTKVGRLEPHTPETRKHYEELLVEQTRLAEEAKPTILEEAGEVLDEADGFRLEPLDFPKLLDEGLPKTGGSIPPTSLPRSACGRSVRRSPRRRSTSSGSRPN
jgi:hypothetical protein